MVNLYSSLSSMDLKKIAFSDQVLSSQRRKIVSPCSFGIALFFIVLSALLFSVTSKGPFLQGLYNLGSRGNDTSFVSWTNSSSSSSSVTPNLQFPLNETLDANVTVKSGKGEKGFESAPAGDQSVKFEDVSFIVEGSVGVERGARNRSQPVGGAILVDDSGGRRESGVPRIGDSTVKSIGDEQSSCGPGIESLEGGRVGNCSNEGSNGGLGLGNGGVTVPAPAGGDRSYKNCDIFNGRWVRDDDAEPYYPPGSCPYIDRDFDCHLNGRPDSEYIKWRWQPYDCSIPRYGLYCDFDYQRI